MHLSQREILIGKYKHAAYKPCYWTEQSLRTGGRRQCYKHDFGIKSHQCIQSTSFRGCNIACTFCWRDVEGRQHSFRYQDEPETIAEELVQYQKALIEQSLPFALDNYENMIKVVQTLSQGEMGIPEIAEKSKVSRMRVKDAMNDLKNAGVAIGLKTFTLREGLASEAASDPRNLIERLVASRDDIINVHLEAAQPKHVAISYDGEPTQYTRLGELIQEFRKRGISTFLVTNGTFPERIKALEETGSLPTQLYVTMAAPDRETYLKVCSSVKPYFPVNEDHWDRLNKTLGMLSSLDCRTVIRITSVRGVNMIKPESYRQKVKDANPSFLEVKGFSISGNAPRISERLGETKLGDKDPSLLKNALKYAPTHDEMQEFARLISDNYRFFPLINQSEVNRQVLMGVAWKGSVGIDFQTEL
ncbi:MAG: radical SAM protein [Nitrososphaerota archaeon]|jgi:wyosine [tRNA(Phe)-imidazoG37] synthetase (radical SAM superfamily)|nr:radical SAM protein [Nitrososphaerota archaeon]MDG6922040.1 radical SAM protein [Nitrososphaerota archaeon]